MKKINSKFLIFSITTKIVLTKIYLKIMILQMINQIKIQRKLMEEGEEKKDIKTFQKKPSKNKDNKV